ncbi:hypothetical protein [Streptomyces sp. 6N106]|uniref:hypothetical protein n=1 Tax=Streptomyces sp. 6N106 TaxID=3457418 RepID=UPI003FD03FC0
MVRLVCGRLLRAGGVDGNGNDDRGGKCDGAAPGPHRREGVAWTFGVDADPYRPERET